MAGTFGQPWGVSPFGIPGIGAGTPYQTLGTTPFTGYAGPGVQAPQVLQQTLQSLQVVPHQLQQLVQLAHAQQQQLQQLLQFVPHQIQQLQLLLLTQSGFQPPMSSHIAGPGFQQAGAMPQPFATQPGYVM